MECLTWFCAKCVRAWQCCWDSGSSDRTNRRKWANDYILFQISVMTDFFTPIQVCQESQACMEQYEITKYNTDPFSPTLVRIESLGDHRRKIMQWLKSMPISSRMSRLTFTNKQFVCLIITMFERFSNRQDCLIQFGLTENPDVGFRIAEERFISKPNMDLLEAEKKLIESILIVNRYSRYDSITVDETLAADVNHLFELFDIIENGVSHELTSYNYHNYTGSSNSHIMFYNPVEHDCSITKTLGLWFVEVIKKNLCVQYFRECVHPIPNPKSPAHEESEPEKEDKLKAKQFKKYWLNVPEPKRQNLISNIFGRDIRAILTEYRQTIKISGDSFPCLKYCHPDEISGFIAKFTLMGGESVLDQLKYTHLKDSTFDIGLYKYEAFIEIEADIQRKKIQALTIAKKKINKLAQQKKNRQKVNDVEDTRVHIVSKQETIVPKALTRANQSSEVCLVEQKQKKNTAKRQVRKFRMQEVDAIEVRNEQQEKQLAQKSDKANKEKVVKQVEQNFSKIMQEFSTRLRKWNRYQEIAINRLLSVLSSYNLSYQVFGSYANGLAIPKSDVDICISPTITDYFYSSFCSFREKVIMSLQFLWACFANTGWASNFKLITTASVPLLAFEVDLSIPFGDPRNSLYNTSRPSQGPKIYIDLTIEPYANMQKELVPHLGYESTALVKEWMAEFPQLGMMVCIVKYVLYKKQLNKSFTGGISSYALSSLIYSFLKAYQLPQHSLLQTLAYFCDFMASFQENRKVVAVSSPQPFQDRPTSGLTVENYLNGKNLTQNCHRFQEIKQELAQLRETLMSYLHGVSLKEYCRNLRVLLLQ